MSLAIRTPTGAQDRVIAWVDNNIKRVGAYLVDAFVERGSAVAASDNAEELIASKKFARVDHLLMDFDMGGDDGFSKLERILSEVDVVSAYICTGYAHLDELERQRVEYSNKLGRPIGLIRKEHLPAIDPDEEHDEVDGFLSELDDGSYLTDSADLSLDVLVDEQTMPTYSEHRRLTLSERVRVLELGRQLYRTTIDSYFADGFIWLLLDGSTGKVLESAKNTASILPNEVVDRRAEEERFVPLTFSKGWSLDTLDNVCDPKTEMVNYPVLELKPIEKQGSNIVAKSEEFLHFDDGNSFSLLAYEYFLEKGWISAIKNPGYREQGDLCLVGKEVVIKDVEVRDAGGQTRSRDFNAFATMDWTKHRIALQCVDVCPHGTLYPPQRSSKICSRRKGLLGRNLKEQLQVGITTYPGTSKVRFADIPS